MIIKNVNVSKLHDEFIESGIKPYPVFILENGDGDFTFSENTDIELVQQIIAAHDPAPLSLKPTQTEELMNYILEVDFRLIMLEMGLI